MQECQSSGQPVFPTVLTRTRSADITDVHWSLGVRLPSHKQAHGKESLNRDRGRQRRGESNVCRKYELLPQYDIYDIYNFSTRELGLSP